MNALDLTLQNYLLWKFPRAALDTSAGKESLEVPGAVLERSEFFRITIPLPVSFDEIKGEVAYYFVECGYIVHHNYPTTPTYHHIATRDNEKIAVTLKPESQVGDRVLVSIIAAAMP